MLCTFGVVKCDFTSLVFIDLQPSQAHSDEAC